MYQSRVIARSLRPHLLTCLLPWILVGCVHVPPGDLMVQAMVQKSGDRISIQYAEDAVSFLITSPSGIGEATLKVLQGQWPKEVRIRLRYADGRGFTAVEGFSCSIRGRPPLEVRAVTLHPQYAEVLLPSDGLQGTGHPVQVRWVDYYR